MAACLARALAAAGGAVPDKLSQGKEFQETLNEADKFYAEFAAHRQRHLGFRSADDFVATQLALGKSAALGTWLSDAAMRLYAASKEGKQATQQNLQAYQTWATCNTGFLGGIKHAFQVGQGTGRGD